MPKLVELECVPGGAEGGRAQGSMLVARLLGGYGIRVPDLRLTEQIAHTHMLVCTCAGKTRQTPYRRIGGGSCAAVPYPSIHAV